MNYTLPAEWSLQSGVMLTWPHKQSDWEPILPDVEPVFIEIAIQVVCREKLLIVCFDETHQSHIKTLLSSVNDFNLANLRLIVCPSNDSWARDHGPITVFNNNTPVLLDFEFNGWGNKYPHEKDNKITETLVTKNIFPEALHIKPDMILEGGSIEVNGSGLLMTTTQCLLSTERNQLQQSQIEARLAALFNIRDFIWLENGCLHGDDTDAHIDTLARFCNEHTIVYTNCNDQNDPHYESLKNMEQDLLAAAEKITVDLKLIPIPLPNAIFNKAGKRLPATYANFLIINGAVLAPVYNCETDDAAMKILQHCFADRTLVRINCRALVEQYGSLHCVTMQLPDGLL